MSSKAKKKNKEDPQPLNFDNDGEKGPSDRLERPSMTPSDERGDSEDDQYYDEEEALSPEESKLRKEEDDL